VESTDSLQPAEISRVAVRFQPFRAERRVVWFGQAEAQITFAGISNEITEKFYHVSCQLDNRYAPEVEDIITSPPQQDLYTKLRT
jgi:hypothetical protein